MSPERRLTVPPPARAKALPRREPRAPNPADRRLTDACLAGRREASVLFREAVDTCGGADATFAAIARWLGPSEQHYKACADADDTKTLSTGDLLGISKRSHRLALQIARMLAEHIEAQAPQRGWLPAAHVAALAQAVGDFARVAQGTRAERVVALRALEAAVLEALRDEERGAA